MKATIDLFIQLQNIDSAADAIAYKKGALPEELAGLESQLQNLEQELENCENEVEQQKKLIVEYREVSKRSTELMLRYKQEHLNLTNNTEEYDAITKEIALQELDIKLAKKKIKASQAVLTTQTERIAEIQNLLQENKELTQLKKKSLAQIDETTRVQEAKLDEQRKKVIQKIQDTSLLQKYESLRKRLPLVVARVVQEACNGCFIIVPSQRQIKIREAKKIFMCENCDRMLVQAELAPPEEEKPLRRRKAANA